MLNSICFCQPGNDRSQIFYTDLVRTTEKGGAFTLLKKVTSGFA